MLRLLCGETVSLHLQPLVTHQSRLIQLSLFAPYLVAAVLRLLALGEPLQRPSRLRCGHGLRLPLLAQPVGLAQALVQAHHGVTQVGQAAVRMLDLSQPQVGSGAVGEGAQRVRQVIVPYLGIP